MKRIFYIFIFIIGLNFTSFSQNRPSGNEPAEKVLKFYPNPGITYVNFDFMRGYDKSMYLEIYNFMGKKVYEVRTLLPTNTLSLSEFYRGFYSYKLYDKNNNVVEAGRFLVAKR